MCVHVSAKGCERIDNDSGILANIYATVYVPMRLVEAEYGDHMMVVAYVNTHKLDISQLICNEKRCKFNCVNVLNQLTVGTVVVHDQKIRDNVEVEISSMENAGCMGVYLSARGCRVDDRISVDIYVTLYISTRCLGAEYNSGFVEAGAYVKSHKLEISQMICRRHEIQNTFDCQNVSERLTVTRMSYLPDLKPQGEMWVGRLRGSEHERIDPGSMCIIVKVGNCLGNDGGYYEMVVRVYIRTTLLHVIGGDMHEAVERYFKANARLIAQKICSVTGVVYPSGTHDIIDHPEYVDMFAWDNIYQMHIMGNGSSTYHPEIEVDGIKAQVMTIKKWM